MEKYTDRFLLIILGILIPFMILILLIVISVNIDEFKLEFTLGLFLSAALSFILGLFLRKIKYLSVPLMFVVVLFISFATYKQHKKNVLLKHTINWNSPEHTTTIPFYVHSTGHISVKTILNGEEKYLIFDTGADISSLNEAYNVSKIIKTKNITDSQSRTKKVSFYTFDKLTFGSLDLKKAAYISMNKDTWGKCGIFYKQDSIAGILGNNIINNFVWDFDMVNQTVNISDLPVRGKKTNSEVVPLMKKNMGWDIEVLLNKQPYYLKLDTGSNSIIILKDSIHLPKSYSYSIKKTTNSKGFFSYMDCYETELKQDSLKSISTTTIKKRKVFADLKIADTIFKNTYVVDKEYNNLLGVPLFWEYERVLLDFINHKMHLINPSTLKTNRSLSRKSLNERWTMKIQAVINQGYFEHYTPKALQIKTLSEKTKDTVLFEFNQKMKCYAQFNSNSLKIDSIKGIGTVFPKNKLNLNQSDSIKLILSDYKPLNYSLFINDL